jgi:hypothetical protein
MVTTITHTITMAMETDTDTDGTVTTAALVTDTAMAVELTGSVVSLIQVAQCIAKTNHGVM